MRPWRTETWRDAVATAGWLARHSVDCLRGSQRSAERNVEDVIATDGAVAFASGDTARLAT
jgi:hypothetical protein